MDIKYTINTMQRCISCANLFPPEKITYRDGWCADCNECGIVYTKDYFVKKENEIPINKVTPINCVDQLNTILEEPEQEQKWFNESFENEYLTEQQKEKLIQTYKQIKEKKEMSDKIQFTEEQARQFVIDCFGEKESDVEANLDAIRDAGYIKLNPIEEARASHLKLKDEMVNMTVIHEVNEYITKMWNVIGSYSEAVYYLQKQIEELKSVIYKDAFKSVIK